MADVADADRRAADVLDDDVVELLDVLDAAQRANAHFGGPAHDASAGRFDVLGLDRALHVLRAQVVGVQLVEIEKDVDLAVASAADVDAADAVDGLDGAPDLSCRRFRSVRGPSGCR